MTCIYCGAPTRWVGPASALYTKCTRCGATDCTDNNPHGEDEEGDES